jgi:hypothetical protein
VLKYVLPFLVLLASAAQAQMPDPVAAAVGQEWQASEVGRGHLAEALQKLIQAYAAAQEKQKAVDAYWKDYVAGLTKDTQTGSR